MVNAINEAGEASCVCNVTVKGRLPNETSDSEVASDMEPIKPSIQVALKDISVFEGKKVRLDCVIVGQPEPEVIWYHNERPVKESTDFQLLFQGDRCSLIIQEALPEDAGGYKVVALNSAGEASSKCNLTVTPLSDAEVPPAKPQEEAKPAGTPPKFSKLLSDVLVSEGDRVVFEAGVTGEPQPEIKWLLNNQDLKDGDHAKITSDSQGNCRLEIDSVLPEDKGVYTIKATNAFGDAKCFSQLIVKSFKPTEVKKEYEEVKSAPVFKETFQDRTAFEDTSTKFECIVTARPTPKIRWLFNDGPVSGKDFLISTSGERQVLSVPLLSNSHSGKITCVAENEAGKATCTANLSVQSAADITLPASKPMQPTEHIIEVSKQIQPAHLVQDHKIQPAELVQQQKNESSYSFHREAFMQSSQSSTSSRKYEVTSSAQEPPVQFQSTTTKAERSFKQVNQETPQVTQTSITETTVVHKPTVRARPPKFTTPVVGKIVDQGIDIVLEGILDASPAPTVTWTKNNGNLPQLPKITTSFQLNRARLEIKGVDNSDAGRYTCTAVNEAGTAISTADLVIRSKTCVALSKRELIWCCFRNYLPTGVWT